MNITYLLGAGASAGAIPPLNGMKDEMRKLVQKLSEFIPPEIDAALFKTLSIKLQENVGSVHEIIDDFYWLLAEAEHHNTFDTVAKKFYLKSDWSSLIRLKRALIIYFTAIQICGFSPASVHPVLVDKRYDSLIASLAEKLDGRMILNCQVKILTWNYDLQFELSMKRYTDLKIHEIKERFQIFPNQNSFDLTTGELIDYAKFAMVKLNGNAFFDNPSETGEEPKSTLFDAFFDEQSNSKFLGELAYQYKWLHVNNNKLITEALRYFNFAWESGDDFQEKYAGYQSNFKEALKIAVNTQVLVVIGYSFPVFNRDIDKQLFNHMENLQKVYIQDLEPQRIESTMKNAFEVFQQVPAVGSNEVTFQLDDSKNQFVVPYELS
jgi:hypothetical protein